jgi:hypothetical protein
MSCRRLALVTLAALLASVISAATASAAVTKSNVTVPADASFIHFGSRDDPRIQIQGTTDGGTGDRVDLFCTSGAGATFGRAIVAENVLIQSDGSFTYDGPSSQTEGACVIRAVPFGTTLDATTDLSAFTGPRVYLGDQHLYTVQTGPNAGKLIDYALWNSQSAGATGFDAIGSCGVYTTLFDPATLAQSNYMFYCDGYLWMADGTQGSAARSELQIDGRNAYTGWSEHSAFNAADQAPGFLPIAFTPAFSPTASDLTIEETDALVTCKGNPYPPTASTCPAFQAAPVRVRRAITTDHNGRVTLVVDTYSSSDGAAHALDLLYEQDFNPFSGGDPAYRFPWRESAFNQHGLLDSFAGPGGKAPGSIFVKAKKDAADGDPMWPQGAIGYSSPPDDVRFLNYPTKPNSYWALHYRRTVPATGALTLVFVYSTASRAADVAALAHEGEARLAQYVAAGGQAGGGGGGSGGKQGGHRPGAKAFRGVALRGRRLAVRRNRVVLRVVCPAGAVRACAGTATLYAPASPSTGRGRHARPLVFGRARFVVATRHVQRVTVRLRRAGRRALRGHRRGIAAVLALVAQDRAKPRRTSATSVRVRLLPR